MTRTAGSRHPACDGQRLARNNAVVGGAGERAIRVAIADDHAIVREGLLLILRAEEGIEVVGEAKDVDGAVELVSATQPDVLLLDLNLGAESGLDALPRLREVAPSTAVLVLTMQKDALHARHALDAGAAGYVVKDSATRELVRALRTVNSGGTYVEPELGAALIRQRVELEDEPLTERERQVLALLALGHTNAQVAGELVLSVRTVEAHRARIQEKLRISGRSEMVRYALDHGLIEP